MARIYANTNWHLPELTEASDHSYEIAQLALLMDLRNELRTLNRVVTCSNFLAIPTTLRQISRNTAKPRKRRARKSL